MSKKPQTNLTDQIMQAVDGDKVKMHSKTHFYLAFTASVVSLALAFGLTAVFLSMLYREISLGRDIDWVGLTGGRGQLFANLPYVLIAAIIATAVVSYVLIKRFDFSYKHRSNIMILASVLSLALLSAGTYHARFDSHLALDGPRLAPIRNLQDKRIISGTITSVDDDCLTVDYKNKPLKVQLDDGTRMPGRTDFEVGMRIKVFGNWDGDTFDAQGVLPEPKRDARLFQRPVRRSFAS